MGGSDGLYFEFFSREFSDGTGHEAIVEFFVGIVATVSLFVTHASHHHSRVLTMTMTHLVGIAVVVAFAINAAVISVIVVVVGKGVQVYQGMMAVNAMTSDLGHECGHEHEEAAGQFPGGECFVEEQVAGYRRKHTL